MLFSFGFLANFHAVKLKKKKRKKKKKGVSKRARVEGREAALPLVVVFSSALQLSLYKRVSPVAPAPHAFCPPSSGPLCSCSPVSAACVSATDQCKVLCHGSYRTIHWHSCMYLVNTQTHIHTHTHMYACMHAPHPPHTHTRTGNLSCFSEAFCQILVLLRFSKMDWCSMHALDVYMLKPWQPHINLTITYFYIRQTWDVIILF